MRRKGAPPLKPDIRLRGHHLICLHFFRGEGYDRPFIDNLVRVVGGAESGKAVTVAEGPDDVCSACPYLKDGACANEDDAEIAIRSMDKDALRLLNVTVGDAASWQELKERLPGIMAKWKSSHCADCSWLSVCLKNPQY